MAARPTIGIVGTGNLGSALGLALHHAGYKITEVVSRKSKGAQSRAGALAGKVKARRRTFGEQLSADLLWFCVPDREIAGRATAIAQTSSWSGKIAFHSSGALASEELAALRRGRASVASVHPLMTFVRSVSPSLTGVPFALEGDAAAVRVARTIVRSLEGKAFLIAKRYKPAYHAWGAFASPLFIALLVTAEKVAGAAGLSRASARRMMLPILRQTLSNYAAHGPSAAFSGPIVRGDVDTINKHLKILSSVPEAKNVYVALVRSALRELPTPDRKALVRMLGGTNPR
jgi:predicted short-subunit dehydrogenase-like oxidoreductase (DUF2520 family)